MNTELPVYPDVIEIDVSGLITETEAPTDIYSEKQRRLLVGVLHASWQPPRVDPDLPRPFVAFANVGLFDRPRNDALVPDVLVSLDAELPEDVWEKRHRSYFIWEYGKVPDVVVEVVSNRVGDELSRKRSRYARMRIPHYVVWDPDAQLEERRLHVFRLEGDVYRVVPVTDGTPCELAGAHLAVGLWTGRFEDREDTWLRWFDVNDSLLPTSDELARAAEARADAETAKADAAAKRANIAESELAALKARQQELEALVARLTSGESPITPRGE
jgi:Uma2 family endonuclease